MQPFLLESEVKKMYKSPIEIFVDDMITEYENGIVKVLQKYKISCNKEELTKALVYDRDQYKKGFEEGKASVQKIGEWIDGVDVPNRNPYLHLANKKYCSKCLNEAYWDSDYGQQLFDFCPNCGADMRGE